MKTPRIITLVLLLLPAQVIPAMARDGFFEITRLEFEGRETSETKKLFVAKVENGWKKSYEFRPYIQVEVRTRGPIRSNKTYCRAYFYDRQRRLINKQEQPVTIPRANSRADMPFPLTFEKGQREHLYFTLPEKFDRKEQHTLLVVFGDKEGADVRMYPANAGNLTMFDFPEKEYAQMLDTGRRPEPLEAFVEYPVDTGVEKHPRVTLFLLTPPSVKDPSEIAGVTATVLVGHNLDDIRRKLYAAAEDEELAYFWRFANRHKLVILAWGSRGMWDRNQSWYEMDPERYEQLDEDMTEVFAAWGRGVDELREKYDLPKTRMIMHGGCGAAQYACRLALKQPTYFHAVVCENPGSFAKPTPEANRILWLITKGELANGYDASLRFYNECRNLGYPMVFKPLMGVGGHGANAVSSRLAARFKEYALELIDERAQFEAILADRFSPEGEKWRDNPNRPWPQHFQNPPFYGDCVNQVMFEASKVDMIPKPFQVPLPDKSLAQAWDRN